MFAVICMCMYVTALDYASDCMWAQVPGNSRPIMIGWPHLPANIDKQFRG